MWHVQYTASSLRNKGSEQTIPICSPDGSPHSEGSPQGWLVISVA